MGELFGDVPGAREVGDALSSDPIYRALGSRLGSPFVLGIVIAFLIVLIVTFGPSGDSRFIYTDF